MPSAHENLPLTDGQLAKISSKPYAYSAVLNAWELSQAAIATTITDCTPTSFTSVDPLTLTGSGFTGATAVKLNGVDVASFTVNSDTQITANPNTVTTTAPSLLGVEVVGAVIVYGEILDHQQEASGPGLHRYWGLYVTANKGAPSFTGTREIRFRDSGGTNITTGGTPSGPVGVSIYALANAFDDDNSTRYSFAVGDLPGRISYDFGSGNDVEPFDVAIREYDDSANSARNFDDLEIQYSDDGTNWTTAQTYTNIQFDQDSNTVAILTTS